MNEIKERYCSIAMWTPGGIFCAFEEFEGNGFQASAAGAAHIVLVDESFEEQHHAQDQDFYGVDIYGLMSQVDYILS